MTDPAQRESLLGLSGKEAAGLECPYCGCRDFRVVKTWWVRSGDKHSSLVCRHCGKYEFNAKVEKILTLL
jgi:transcription elongation factor Elf1